MSEQLDKSTSLVLFWKKEAERLTAENASLRQCSTCCGTPHASGLPCICGGTNSREEEVKGLRLAAMKPGSSPSTGVSMETVLEAVVWQRERIRQLETGSFPSPELQDALNAWRGLTQEDKERLYAYLAKTEHFLLAQFALRLLKAAAR